MPYKTIPLLLAILLASSCATLQTKQTETDDELSPFSAQGWGGAVCKQLIHDIEPKNVGFQQSVQNIHLYQSWASGFVSGINYENKHVYDVSGGTSPEDTFAWLKQHCSENQDIAIPIALHELLQQWEQEGKIQAQAD